MDCRAIVLVCLAVMLGFIVSFTEGRTKKVVIHVPYKVKKIKHTHTIYKTIHHHHGHRDHLDHLDHLSHSPSEEHEHFHHMHLHDEPAPGKHSKPVPSLGIPEFLPDVPDIPHDLPPLPPLPPLPNRHLIPLFRRS